jgi:hypothetical protein
MTALLALARLAGHAVVNLKPLAAVGARKSDRHVAPEHIKCKPVLIVPA